MLTVFVILIFNFYFSKYMDRVAMSKFRAPSRVCHLGVERMIARSSAYANFLELLFVNHACNVK